MIQSSKKNIDHKNSKVDTNDDLKVDKAEKIELEQENELRPRDLDAFVGQTRIVENLRIMMSAAQTRGESMGHILLHGSPGLGKTTLARIIATEMKSNLRSIAGPSIEKAADLASILTNLSEKDVLFIDEIHRLRSNIEEILYSAMEDGSIDITIGKGPSARIMKIDLAEFTLVGATTKVAMLSKPLRDRFAGVFKLDFYSEEELKEIAKKSCAKLDQKIDDDAVDQIASRSRGTPRIVNRLVRWLRDFASSEKSDEITKNIAKSGLDQLGVDPIGLDAVDKEILNSLGHKFLGKPVGLKTLAASIGEDESTVEDVHEPFLIRQGFINKTPKGRIITQKGAEYIQITLNTQPKLALD